MEDTILNVVDNLLQVGRNDEAIKQCLQLLASEPEHYGARVYLIRAHLQKEEYEKAHQAATALIKLTPEEPFGYFLNSCACYHLKQFNCELRMAEEAVRLEPEGELYIQRLTEAQLQQGLVPKAKQSAEQLVNLAPDSEEAHELLGQICLDTDAYAQAEKHYRAALRINPNALHLLNNLAVALHHQKRNKEAIEVLFNALKQNPNDDILRSNTFEFIKHYLDKHSLKGKRKKALAQLPSPIQIFYRDYQGRSSIFERYSRYAMMLMWVLGLGALTLVIGAFSAT